MASYWAKYNTRFPRVTGNRLRPNICVAQAEQALIQNVVGSGTLDMRIVSHRGQSLLSFMLTVLSCGRAQSPLNMKQVYGL